MEIWRTVFTRKFKMLVTTVASGREGRRTGNWCYWDTVSIGKGDPPLEMDCARWSRQSFGIAPMSLLLQNSRLKMVISIFISFIKNSNN